MPVDGGQYVLDCDASAFAIGCVLSQTQSGEIRVIAYASRHLSPREQNYCTTRRELLAVVSYLKYFRHYLLGAKPHVRVRTDHAAIVWLRRIPEPVGQQARWLETMEEFDFVVEHRSGRQHGNADAMSRDPCHNRRCCPAPCAWREDEAGVETPVEQVEPNEMDGALSRTLVTSGDLRLSAVRATADTTDHIEELADLARIEAEQRADPDIMFIYSRVEEGSGKPNWDQVAALSEMAKSLWRQFDRLSLNGGILVRRFE